jgi:hypothetical protein
MERREKKLRSICIMSRLAIGVLSRTKQEMIDAVLAMDEKSDDHDVCSDGLLRYIVEAREQLEALLAMITAAEIRHACAMANVYSNDEDSLPPIPTPPEPLV